MLPGILLQVSANIAKIYNIPNALGLQTFILNKHGTKAIQLFDGSYFICCVVFQLKLSATSK